MPAHHESASAKELFILGRLSMRPTYGHEIMRTLAESRSDLWVELSEKHVYYVLKKLEREGLVSSEVSEQGGRPARKVFALTPAGRDEFARLLTAEQFVESVPYSEFDVVFGMLAYTDSLADAEKTAVLQRRAQALDQLLDRCDAARSVASGARGAAALSGRVFERLSRVAAAELEWLTDVVDDVTRNGWPKPDAEKEVGR